MRMKTKWYKKDKNHSLDETARALAFVCWQIAVDRVKNMERWNYYVDLPDRTLNVISELLIFLAHVSDRSIYEKFNQEERGVFLNALAKRLAEIVEDNRIDIKDATQTREQFIGLVNTRFMEYSAFNFNDHTPGYSAYRFLGQKVSDIIGEQHNKGVAEQVTEVEGPEGVHYLQKAMSNLIGLAF